MHNLLMHNGVSGQNVIRCSLIAMPEMSNQIIDTEENLTCQACPPMLIVEFYVMMLTSVIWIKWITSE